MKKKLIFVTEALWIGGIETALVNLLDRLDYDRFEVTCLVLRASLELAGRIPPRCRLLVADRDKTVSFSQGYAHARLYHLTEPCENPSPRHRQLQWTVPILRWVENRLYIRYIRSQLKKEKFDTCVIYSDRVAEAAVRGIRAKNYLMFYHHGAMRRVYHDEIGYRKSSAIIAVSPPQAKLLRAFRPRYAGKILALPNMTDVSGIRRRAQEAVPETFDDGTFHIVSCGRVAREKGMDMAAEACALLKSRGITGFHWWIVGGGPEEQALRRQIRSLGLEDEMTVLGLKENPYAYIKQADLYVQPSRVESFGLTILEALILDRPVISTATGGAKALAADYPMIQLCPISPEAIAEEIFRYLAEPPAHRESVPAAQFEAQNQKSIRALSALLEEGGIPWNIKI